MLWLSYTFLPGVDLGDDKGLPSPTNPTCSSSPGILDGNAEELEEDEEEEEDEET